MTSHALAVDVTLSWNDPNNSPSEVGGYNLYYWQTGATPIVVNVGKTKMYTLTGLAAGETYHFATTAHDGSGGRESAFSNQVPFTVPATSPPPPPPAANAFIQDSGSNGLVVAEAEHFHARTSQSGHSWNQGTRSGASGGSVMQATPNNGATLNTGYVTSSPRLDFRVQFVRTGTHYVWIRGIGPSESDDSVHVGLDGQAVASSDRLSTFSSSWAWSKSTMDGVVATMQVSTIGVHTMNVWMREDGFVFDKLVLTTSASYTPSGTGPNETTSGAPSSPPPPPDGGSNATGLIAAYSFNEGNGLSVADASGNANNGTISGATWTTQGKFGSALSFDGVNDWVTVPDASTLDLTTGMTLEAWVYPTTTTGVRDILIKEGANVDIYNLYARNSRGRPESNVLVGGVNRMAEGTSLPANVWTHVAGTYDGTTLRLFINGVQVAATPISGAIAVSTGVLRIGGNSLWGEYFQGRIDEVRIYNRTLTTSAIQADMNTGQNTGGAATGSALTASKIQADINTPVTQDPHTDSDYDGFANSLEIHYGTDPLDPNSMPLLTDLTATGEVNITHNWTHVNLSPPFLDPVVIAKPLSANNGDRTVVRIRNITPTGFDLRVQEWDYLKGTHTTEAVAYLVIERGPFVFEDANGKFIRVEAGTFATHRTTFMTVPFSQSFSTTPVVITTVTTVNEADAVTGRLRKISRTRFQFRLQEQESNTNSHATETIAYVAWEPVTGTIDGLTVDVDTTGNVVSDAFYSLGFNRTFSSAPVFLADMQTANGVDTANPHWRNKGRSGVQVQVDEEQSQDNETGHTTEVVGYIAIR